jgi:hypothetical protein
MTHGTQSCDMEPMIIIYLGSERQQIPQSEFLKHVWERGLDSVCMVCQKDFTGGGSPAIRTLSFEPSEDMVLSSVDITKFLSLHIQFVCSIGILSVSGSEM